MSSFTQLCVWPGMVVADDGSACPDTAAIRAFEKWFSDEFGVTVKYEATVVTLPSKDENGEDIQGTGGRIDAFFWIDSEDVGKIAVPRLAYDIRWWEDVGKYNNGANIYPIDFVESHPYTW